MSRTSEAPWKAVIFYNLYTASSEDIPRVSALVREQLSSLDPTQHQLQITSIAAVTDISQLGLNPEVSKSATFRHVESGREDVTLHEVWSYCQTANPSQVVAYLHSKGSFHPDIPGQDQIRDYNTAGALAPECLSMPETCNVCSARFSPIPHPHTPGNMWAARCGYVSKLLDPTAFPLEMVRYYRHPARFEGLQCPTSRKSCVGVGRFALEHWVHSHPDVQPCDLDSSSAYRWRFPGTDPEMKAMTDFVSNPKVQQVLQPAPRFDLATYERQDGGCSKCGFNMTQRVDEYKFLHQQEPPATWWGWKFMKSGA
eukprot:Skav217946  [mRNA]  locus=scaffold2100:113282:114217:+ [translate_table: standard]